MEYIVYISLFLTSSLLFYLFYDAVLMPKQVVKERLDNVKVMADTRDAFDEEMRESFAERVINPVYERMIHGLGNLAPSSIREQYELLLSSSGTKDTVKFNNVIAIQLMLGLLLAFGTHYLMQLTEQPTNGLYVALAGAAGFLLPYTSLRTKSRKRIEGIERALPSFLDVLYVSVEAGLAFDMAIYRTTDKMKGPLSEELLFTMNEINKGRGRSEALREMVKRTQVADLGTFVTSIIQAEEMGSNIGNVLRIQADTMRLNKRQRAEALAAKIPTKMLFPIVFFMFPALFVVILGPAVLNIMETLMK
ncbi:type II secretion system F family protein [Trichococcus ilyis]|uniref:Tight adherence protein C n=1 Tax=Trichococcus ilyis TaxID=640938 RepID=A0A143Z915_9LACT|nr:type II secretion system F family protein [Trichococcus ilyis]CZR10338.1 type ii secretion system (t2ss) protein f [Trichococcus ilyis]SEJ95301.1 tight adherence protein C [Trichococcus ilyis]